MRPRALIAPHARLIGALTLALAVAWPLPGRGAPAAQDVVREPRSPPESGADGDAPATAEAAAPAEAEAEAEVDIAAMEAARRTADAQALADAGDYDGAIALWSHLMATIPRSAAYAPRRASLLLAIVDAHARAYEAEHDPRRLRVAIELLDRYLGELDPTDDENRIAVEGRRRGLAARLGAAEAAQEAAGDDVGPVTPAAAAVDPRAVARRWTIAGGSLIGAGVLGLAVMGMGMILGDQADRDLEAAVDRVLTDPGRGGAIDAAEAAGVQANKIAYAGGVIGGVLTVAGALAVIRGRRIQLRLTGGPGGGFVGVGGRF